MQVRKDLWGYAPDEDLSCDDMLKVKYQGIRPAPGYPSQPDHTEKNAMWELMNVKDEIDCELTESLAMLPAASVSGTLFFMLRCLPVVFILQCPLLLVDAHSTELVLCVCVVGCYRRIRWPRRLMLRACYRELYRALQFSACLLIEKSFSTFTFQISMKMFLFLLATNLSTQLWGESPEQRE